MIGSSSAVRFAHDFQTGDIRFVLVDIFGFAFRKRKGRVFDDGITDAVKLFGCAKTEVAIFTFGRSVNPTSLVAVEGHLFFVVGDPVLSHFRADRFEPVANVAHDGKIVPDGVLLLNEHVVDRDD